MQFFNVLKKESEIETFRIILVALTAGIINGLIMVAINGAASAAEDQDSKSIFFILFAFCITGLIVSKRYSLLHTHVLVEKIIGKIRNRISEKIRHVDYLLFQNIGKELFYTTLARETQIISDSAALLANASSALIMIIFCIMYIANISSVAFLLTGVVVVCGVSLFLWAQKSISKHLELSTLEENLFFNSLNHLLNGFKEIKLNSKKGDDLYNGYLVKHSSAAEKLKLGSQKRIVTTILISQTFIYFFLATMVFILPMLISSGKITTISPEEISKLTTVSLFFIGPLTEFVGAIPYVSKANVALNNIFRLETKLKSVNNESSVGKTIFASKVLIDEVRCEDLEFHYYDSKGKSNFNVGPANLSFQSGEVTFIVGGNGCGKSTLLNMISGLYYRDSGRILADGIEVNRGNIQDYRDKFSAIFSDFHLFDRLYGIENIDLDKLHMLLKKMELHNKVDYIDGKFTNMELSTGQKKRLAMVTTMMEDKPIYIFDEWAADQDPSFRQFFYEDLLVQMRKEKKIIIVVSHDDRFFSAADKIYKMEYGKIVDTTSTKI